jgi:hypothetical protein
MAEPKAKSAKSLEMRVTQLENAISKLSQGKKPADVSADELKTYHKVRDALIVDYCISECERCVGLPCISCHTPCVTCRTPCISECSCGPCLMSKGGGSGGFKNLGG